MAVKENLVKTQQDCGEQIDALRKVIAKLERDAKDQQLALQELAQKQLDKQ